MRRGKKGKLQGDQRRHFQETTIKAGTDVLLRQERENTNFRPNIVKVVGRFGNTVELDSEM